MTAYIRTRATRKGEPRFAVKYREAGRGPLLHAGTFVTRADAEHRLRLVRAQLASGAPVRFTDLPTPVAYRWIYFVRMGLDGPIKIGNAVDVDRRIRQLQTANPYPLALLTKVPWVAGEEERLHVTFRHAQLTGEWFRPVPELVAHVRALAGEDHRAEPNERVAAVWQAAERAVA